MPQEIMSWEEFWEWWHNGSSFEERLAVCEAAAMRHPRVTANTTVFASGFAQAIFSAYEKQAKGST